MSYLYQDLGLMGATLALQSAQKRMTGLDVAKTSVGARALLAEEEKKKRRKKKRKKRPRAVTVRAYQAPTSVQHEILRTAPKTIAVPAYQAPPSVQREIARAAAAKKITVPAYRAPTSVQREIVSAAKPKAPVKESLPAFAETQRATTAPPPSGGGGGGWSGGGGGGWSGGGGGGSAAAPSYAAEPEPFEPIIGEDDSLPWVWIAAGGAALIAWMVLK